jgi:hypothetical protein
MSVQPDHGIPTWNDGVPIDDGAEPDDAGHTDPEVPAFGTGAA